MSFIDPFTPLSVPAADLARGESDPEFLARVLRSRAVITVPAAAVLQKVRLDVGEVIFHQSGGCCEGSGPILFKEGRFRIASVDRLLGYVLDGTGEGAAAVPVWISGRQFTAWEHTQIIIDVMEDAGAGGFSLEADLGYQFLSRARVFSDEEYAALAPAPTRRELDEGAHVPATVAPLELTGDFGDICALPF